MSLRKIIFYSGLFIVLFIIGFNAANRVNKDTTIRRTGFFLGTIVEIQIRDLNEEKAQHIMSKAFKEFSRIDDLLSIYKETSSVWKINNSRDSLVKIDTELYSLLKKSKEFTEITNGAFDVTIDTLISLWGFGKEIRSVPDKKELQSALLSSGIHNLTLKDPYTIIRNNNLKFNFGAVAAGYAVDKVCDILRKEGVRNALINGGGEISAIGNNWSIGIQHPRVPGALLDKIRLNGFSIATSGDYEQYFEENGVRYHHILDPKNGMPATECQSVTIIAGNNTIADALATGVFVLGPENGMALVEKLKDVEAIIVDKKGNVHKSSGYSKFLLR